MTGRVWANSTPSTRKQIFKFNDDADMKFTAVRSILQAFQGIAEVVITVHLSITNTI